jgi:hypothetical protein
MHPDVALASATQADRQNGGQHDGPACRQTTPATGRDRAPAVAPATPADRLLDRWRRRDTRSDRNSDRDSNGNTNPVTNADRDALADSVYPTDGRGDRR